MRRGIVSGECKQAEAAPGRQGSATAQEPSPETDPCSRLLDRLLPVDAPTAYDDLAAATESNPARVPSTAAAVPEDAAPPRPRTGRGRGRRRCEAHKAARSGARPGAARALSRRTAGQKSTAACSGGHVPGIPGGDGGVDVGGGHTDVFADVALDPEHQLSMRDLLGTERGHEELLAQLDAAQEILAQGMDDLLAGCGMGASAALGGAVAMGVYDTINEAGVEDSD